MLGAHSAKRNPDWVSHRVADLADAAGVKLNIKALRHYTASQLLAAGFDVGNIAARLGRSGGATTLKHYADPTPRSTAAPPTSHSSPSCRAASSRHRRDRLSGVRR